MSWSIFYSWQSDSPSRCNRTLIRQALDEAVASFAGVTVEDSPRVESGMEGIAGTPEVATVMFTKIKKSAIFIGDMTLVGSIPKVDPNETKFVPNPNVLLEMGYAAGTIGWDRIICVMNEYDKNKERKDLPFDVRNRRFPINYKLPLDVQDNAIITKARTDLAKWIQFAIKAALANEFELAKEAIGALDINCLNLMRQYGTVESFAAQDPNVTAIGGPLDTARFTSATLRLLDLRLIKAEIGTTQALNSYRWTYLGSEVLRQLRLRM